MPNLPYAKPDCAASAASPLRDEFIDRQAFDDWFATYRVRLQQEQIDDDTRQARMKAVNPAMVLRNWLACDY
ncbi:MAG: hypothetical protein ACLTXH_03875 [Enterobacter hormaechei]